MTPLLAHLAEALRAHRQAIGAGRVPAALVALEAELWAALSGTTCAPRPAGPAIGNAERVLVDTSQAAAMLALSPRKVRSLVASGRLPAVRVDTAVRFRVADVHAFAADNLEETA